MKRSEVDYGNFESLTAAFRADKPSFLIIAAGGTGKPNVDACELHKAECLESNAVLPGKIAEVCAAAGVPWGHVSSGCIHTGTRSDDSGFTENDPPNFTFCQNYCSFYSDAKALGEEVLAEAPNVSVCHLRILFNHRDGHRNLVQVYKNAGVRIK